MREAGRQGGDIFAMNLDQFEVGLGFIVTLAPPGSLGAHLRVRRLHEGRLAHAPRAPEQGVVGAMPACELLRVGQQDVAHLIDPPKHAQRHAADLGDREQGAGLTLPMIGVCRAQRERLGLFIRGHHRPRNCLERFGNPAQIVAGLHVFVPCSWRGNLRVLIGFAIIQPQMYSPRDFGRGASA